MIPGEIYPAEVRATCHGVSAACGKLGAATGAFFFPLILGPAGSSHPTDAGLRTSMFLCAAIAFLGCAVTYFFTPRYGAHELEVEDNYLLLEHPCLQPSAADLLLLEASKEAKGQGMMFEVVEAIFDEYNEESYVVEDSDDVGVGVALDEDGGLIMGQGRKEFNSGTTIRGVGGGYQSIPNGTMR